MKSPADDFYISQLIQYTKDCFVQFWHPDKGNAVMRSQNYELISFESPGCS
jgi:hypothetical protein